MHWVKVQIQ
jgi:hypothetical protein